MDLVKAHKLKKRYIISQVFGHSLEDTVQFIAVATVIIAAVCIVVSVFSLIVLTAKDSQYSKNPLLASNLILVMVLIPMSLYQVIISVMLLYRTIKPNESAFLCNLWFSSHVSICGVYAILFFVKILTSLLYGYYIVGVLTLISAIAYEGLFIFFIFVMNSFLELEADYTNIQLKNSNDGELIFKERSLPANQSIVRDVTLI